MIFSDLKKRTASYINYLTDGNTIHEGEITTSDIENWLNDRYLEDAFVQLAERSPEFYTQESTVPTYYTNVVASSSSTSYTLVATTQVFSEDMVGFKVYNSTDEEWATITAYTDGFTVTLDTEIGNTWDGDTLYIFSGTYSFGGDISANWYKVLYVGVKYNSTDNDYRRCSLEAYNDINKYQVGQDNNSLFSEIEPVYIFDTVSMGNKPVSCIKIRPVPEVVLSKGVFVRYVRRPNKLENSTDEPRLPRGSHLFLVYGAVADCYRKMEKFDVAELWEARYQMGLKKMLNSFQAERQKRKIDFISNDYIFYGRR